MVTRREKLVQIGNPQPPATAKAIKAVELSLGQKFPKEYVDFLKVSNGLEATHLVHLYACEDLAERNETYEVAEYAPGWITIGDDSGGRGIFLDLTNQKLGHAPVYMQDHGSIGDTEYNVLASSLTDWLNNGCPLDKK